MKTFTATPALLLKVFTLALLLPEYSADVPVFPTEVPVFPTDVPVFPTDVPVLPTDVPVFPTAVSAIPFPVFPNKNGVCPMMPWDRIVCKVPQESRCSTDRDCPCEQKCCDVPCGRRCVQPLSANVKVGLCPLLSVTTIVSNGFKWDQCATDDQCPGCLKCCLSQRGKQCMQPMPGTVPKVGVCPFVDTSGIRCLVYRDQCNSDKQCPCAQKCCNTYCGRRCIDAPLEIVKPGVCPYVDMTTIRCKRPIDNCFTDNDCPCNQKCCQGGCGRICIPPVRPGICPIIVGPFPIRPMLCRILCTHDDNCKPPQKCCTVGCSRICKMPWLE